MSEILSEEWQRLIASSAELSCRLAADSVRDAAAYHSAPSAVYRPALSIDGDQWCALYGDNLQDGVAGFGDSPEAAMWDFDKSWSKQLPRKEASHA